MRSALITVLTACSLEHTRPVTSPDEVDLSGYPTKSAVAVAVDAFSTTSTDYVDVPGASLTVIASEGDTWMVLFSARIGSSTTKQPSPYAVSYTIDGIERGTGTAQSGVADTLGPWQHLDWFQGAGAPVKIQVRLRSGSSATATISDASIVAFRMPSAAALRAMATDNAQLVTHSAYAAVDTLTFTPDTPGDYLVLGVVNGQESPGQSDIFVRWRTPSGALWNDYLQNPRGDLQSFFVARRITLNAAPQTFTAEALGSSTGAGSTVQLARLAAFRLDGFEAAYTDEVATLSATATTPVTVTHVTTEATAIEKPHVVIQSLGTIFPCGNADASILAPGFTVADTATSNFTYAPGSCVYRPTFGDVRLVVTAEAFDAATTLAASPITNTAREASTHVLRLSF